MSWRSDNNWWPRPSCATIIFLLAGAAFALWLIITGGEPLWR